MLYNSLEIKSWLKTSLINYLKLMDPFFPFNVYCNHYLKSFFFKFWHVNHTLILNNHYSTVWTLNNIKGADTVLPIHNFLQLHDCNTHSVLWIIWVLCHCWENQGSEMTSKCELFCSASIRPVWCKCITVNIHLMIIYMYRCLGSNSRKMLLSFL